MLEAREHDVSCMVTLTLREEVYEKRWHPPLVSGYTHGPEVLVREAQDFLKRLRVARLSRGESRSFRYYIVGEYGDATGRAHYHLALFGFGNLGIIAACWPYGRVQLDELNERTAAYICGYMAEKGSEEYEKRVGGRAEEFALMSLRPGLGALQADRVADAIASSGSGVAVQALVDVPAVLATNGKKWPLGRYLQGRIREMVGLGARVPEARQRVVAGKLLAEVDASGSVTAYLRKQADRRRHDAVKARQKLSGTSKLVKGKIR